jgi:hypothetical protein
MTVQFYEGAAQRLAPGGIFAQFLQAYEIDSATLKVVYATLGTVFRNIETWQTKRGDLLLVASMEPLPYDAARLRQRFAQEPFRSAALGVWHAADLEGVLAHYAAGPSTAAALASGARANTDDRAVLEYGFARTLGNSTLFHVDELLAFAKGRGDDLPPIAGAIDRTSINAQRAVLTAGNEPTQLLITAEALADRGDDSALPYLDQLRRQQPTEASAILARLRLRQGRAEEATAALEQTFARARRDPWPSRTLMLRTLELAGPAAAGDPARARRLSAALSAPFAAALVQDARQLARLEAATMITPGRCNGEVVAALAPFERGVPWNRQFLQNRATCYEQLGHPLAAQARRDYERLLQNEPAALSE